MQQDYDHAPVHNMTKAIQSMVVLLELPQWFAVAMKRPEPLLIAKLGPTLREGIKLSREPLLHRPLDIIKKVLAGTSLVPAFVFDDARQSP